MLFIACQYIERITEKLSKKLLCVLRRLDMFRIVKKFNSILNKGQKIRIAIIVILMLIGAVLETLGVSLIVPLMTAILDDELYQTNKWAVMVCEMFGLHSQKEFMIAILGALIVVFIVKDVFIFFEYYVQTRFICNNRLLIQRNLMEVYLHRPYEFYLNASSGEIMRVITSDTSGAFNLLTIVLNFFTELIVSAVLICAIFIIDPVMAGIVAAVLIVEMLLIYKAIKPVLRKAGLNFQKMNANSNKWVLQAVSGIKELKVGHKENYFLEQYEKYAKRAIVSEKKNTTLNQLPRLMIEAVTVAAMLAVMILLLLAGRDMSTLMPQLAAFAVAAVRLLPSANRMSTAMNAVAYQEPALDKMIENLKAIDGWENGAGEQNHRVEKLTLNNKCELRNITFAYPNAEQSVLVHADLVIPVGKSVGIVGTSGSGKTTAVDILLGLLHQQEGQVLSDGKDIRDNYEKWLSMIGYIPQMIYMLDDTIRANVAFGISRKETNDEQVWKALDEAQLKEFVQSLPDGLDTEIGERGVRLSGGQRQRIGIARALYTDPQLLIFDEATSALDNETEAAIMESINALHGKKTMVIIAHRLTTIEGCDLVYRVENEKIMLEKVEGHVAY